MKALIDADILVYRVGFTTESEELDTAIWRLNNLVEKILEETKATSYNLFLTASNDSTAFRRKVYPEYKQNRKAPKPLYYQELREFLINEWGAEVVSGIEADDALGINQTDTSVICSIDKDLDMIPGWHYNFVKEEAYHVDGDEGIRNFYMQVLTGDTADNVKGIPGIGKKKAERILEGAADEEDLFELVREAYSNDHEMLINAEVLWILKEPYPRGLYSSTLLGSRLKQSETSMSTSDSQTESLSTESIGEDHLMVGFQQDGINKPESTDSTENPPI